MKRSLVILSVLCLLLGCATYPPPKIEGNKYQNYRHAFALELPGEPWKPTDKLPAWFKSWLIAADVPTFRIQLVLLNNQTNAIIMVNCSKSRLDILDIDREFLRKSLQKDYEQIKNESLKSGQVTRYDYNVGRSDISRGESRGESSLYWSHEADIETEIQKIRIISRGNMYPIHDDTHFIEIGLWSDQLTFNENLEVYDKLYKSLEWSEDFTVPTAE